MSKHSRVYRPRSDHAIREWLKRKRQVRNRARNESHVRTFASSCAVLSFSFALIFLLSSACSFSSLAKRIWKKNGFDDSGSNTDLRLFWTWIWICIYFSISMRFFNKFRPLVNWIERWYSICSGFRFESQIRNKIWMWQYSIRSLVVGFHVPGPVRGQLLRCNVRHDSLLRLNQTRFGVSVGSAHFAFTKPGRYIAGLSWNDMAFSGYLAISFTEVLTQKSGMC